jgi:hypothetical protein
VLLGPDMPTAFAQSNPGGRNSGILRSLSDNFYIGSVVAVEERPVSKGADWEEAGTMLVIQDFRPHNFRSKGRTVHLPLSAIVSAIGPTTDVSPVIDPGLLNSLTVVPGCLALATENEDFILFGSGAYSQAKSLKQAVSFDEAGKLIRQPAVGVATIDMGAREFSRTKQDAWKIKQDVALSEIQPSSASAQEFRGMLQRHGVDMKAAEEMTAQILEARAGIAVHREYTNSDLADHLHKLFSGKPLVEAENKS